eukprot:scaffold271021_cov30-Tisochrysis_lutea.AAC.2
MPPDSAPVSGMSPCLSIRYDCHVPMVDSLRSSTNNSMSAGAVGRRRPNDDAREWAPRRILVVKLAPRLLDTRRNDKH